MTLEERLARNEAVEVLVVRIKGGETSLIQNLWDLVEGVATRKAYDHFWKNRSMSYYAGGLDFDDLYQECFLCMLSAIEHYSVENRTGNGGFTSYLAATMDYHCMNLVLKRPGCPNYGTKNILDCSASLDAPLEGGRKKSGDKNKQCLADIIPAPDFSSDVEHQIWIEELRDALEVALASIKEEQATALRRRYAGDGPALTPEEKRLADRGLASLRSKPATRRILHDFVCCL